MKKVQRLQTDAQKVSDEAYAFCEPSDSHRHDSMRSLDDQAMYRRIGELSRKLSAQSLAINVEMTATLQDGLQP